MHHFMHRHRGNTGIQTTIHRYLHTYAHRCILTYIMRASIQQASHFTCNAGVHPACLALDMQRGRPLHMQRGRPANKARDATFASTSLTFVANERFQPTIFQRLCPPSDARLDHRRPPIKAHIATFGSTLRSSLGAHITTHASSWARGRPRNKAYIATFASTERH